MGFSTAKLVGMGIGLLAVIAFVLMAFHWKAQASDRKEKLETICSSTRAASGQPKLKCADVAVQIGFMGETIGAQSRAISSQNAAVAAHGKETERQQGEAARASRIAQERSRAPLATSRGLDASSRSSERQSQPCVPSKALREAW